MQRFLAFTIVVLAVTASAAFAGGEGGALGNSPARISAVRASNDMDRNGWKAYDKSVSSRNEET